MVAEADHGRVHVSARLRRIAARRRIGEARRTMGRAIRRIGRHAFAGGALAAWRGFSGDDGGRARGALRLGGDALPGRPFSVMAARIGVTVGVPVRALAALDQRGALGAPVGAAAAARALAPRRFDFIVGGQLSSVLPVDLARDELLDLGDRLLVDARVRGSARRPVLPARPVRPMRWT